VRAPQAGSSSATEAKHEAATAAAIGQANSSSATETKDEAATAAAIGQSNDGTVTRGSKTDPHGPASLLPTGGQRPARPRRPRCPLIEGALRVGVTTARDRAESPRPLWLTKRPLTA
jgi:hypothetical protein